MNRLQSLALSEDGFVFDPRTGESFTTNKTGLFIIKALTVCPEHPDIVNNLIEKFEVSPDRAERDMMDFVEHLRIFKLL